MTFKFYYQIHDKIHYEALRFYTGFSIVAKKASRSVAALARLMPNVRGTSQWNRRLLASVTESQLLYAAPVWSRIVAVSARIRANLIRPQKSAALRVIRAYWTVFDKAALLLAFMPPTDLIGLERLRIRERLNAPAIDGAIASSKAAIKKEERRRTRTSGNLNGPQPQMRMDQEVDLRRKKVDWKNCAPGASVLSHDPSADWTWLFPTLPAPDEQGQLR